MSLLQGHLTLKKQQNSIQRSDVYTKFLQHGVLEEMSAWNKRNYTFSRSAVFTKFEQQIDHRGVVRHKTDLAVLDDLVIIKSSDLEAKI